MGNRGTYINFRNKASGDKMAAAYRKQNDLGLDGLPRRRGKQRKGKPPEPVESKEEW